MVRGSLKYFLFFLILVILLKYPTFNLLYHWDETVLVYYGKWFSTNGFFSIPPNHDGHVPLFSWILATGYTIFGETPFLSRLIVALLSFVAVYFTYLLGKFLYNKQVGIIASLLMFFSPIYFAISGQALIDIPLVTFTVITLYFGLKKKITPYLISACLLILVKEPGFLVIIALSFYQLIKKEKLKTFLIYISPLLILFIWLFWYYMQTGHMGWFKPYRSIETLNLGWFKLPIPDFPMIFKKSVTIIYQLFFWNYHWIPALIICVVIFFRKKNFKFKKDSIPFLIIIGLFLLAFSYVNLLPRYLLPLYPFFFIFSAHALNSFRKKWVIFLMIIILFISAYRWNYGLKGFIQDPVFHSTIFYPRILTSIKNGEVSLDYIDVVELEKSALDFIFTNYPNSTITSGFPLVLRRNIGVMDIGYRQWIRHNITVLFPINEENINRSNLVIVESYSNWYENNKDEFSDIFSNLELIKKFEKNEKFLIIYRGRK